MTLISSIIVHIIQDSYNTLERMTDWLSSTAEMDAIATMPSPTAVSQPLQLPVPQNAQETTPRLVVAQAA
jgi:hypothetical protein